MTFHPRSYPNISPGALCHFCYYRNRLLLLFGNPHSGENNPVPMLRWQGRDKMRGKDTVIS